VAVGELSALGAAPQLARALWTKGMALKMTRAIDEAEATLTASRRLSTEIGDELHAAHAAVQLAELGLIRMLAGARPRDDVRRLARDAARTFERLGNSDGLGMALAVVGGEAMLAGRSEKASEAYERARALLHEQGDGLAESAALKALSMVRLKQQRIGDALEAVQAAGALASRLQSRGGGSLRDPGGRDPHCVG
jgi:tetratricopeptide (TPR) repeat protein